jgi:hypothetical protein
MCTRSIEDESGRADAHLYLLSVRAYSYLDARLAVGVSPFDNSAGAEAMGRSGVYLVLQEGVQIPFS